ncbi:NAD-dependent DNA ligase LigA [Campylobacter porcelli]|uniref:DNA ligase n=1 Tax=Campylobacter porcelli TaxID=1660073 RepID=A0A1X9SWU4_9BACT|nr:NAD-dependent DNA ligase LigA [Campylobacter sp. RM6137]ARR00737.1 DNA ligase, NAD-dependent [Campylobacter sp. RM6137]MEE3776179.1 NAD-dependent DNA ligase LigA [Campylobacter sp. CX2-4080-23]
MNQKEYLEAVDTLNIWAKAYYTDDIPIASDDEYDALYHKVVKFEKENPSLKVLFSPTNRIGGEILDQFEKLAHKARMWSMEDIFSDDELLAWIERGDKGSQRFFVEPKFDGASLNLTYENGILKSAATRGDGEIGEDVTNNAKVISSIPLKIPYDGFIEIRGEVVIAKKDFEEINAKRIQDGLNLLANPRNAAAGSLRQLDPSITKSRRLKFYPWGVGANELKFATHSQMMEFVRSLGFLRDDFIRVCNSVDEVKNAYSKLLLLRDEKPIMMDGMVVRIDSLAKCDELGFTVKFPKFMVAYKFPATQKSAKLLDIALQVGRTGVVTPVGILDGVEIDGAFVRNVTLHNFDEIERLGLMKGDMVCVIRSGDVIPKITDVYKSRRDGTQSNIERPTNCPKCGSELLDEGVFIKCQNLSCKARVVSSIIYFASKKCMNIDGLGDAIIELLYENGKISSIIDIYRLDRGSFNGLEGFKDKKIDNILNAINISKTPPLHRFITSLGIEHIGEVAAKKIASTYPNNWLNLNQDELLSLDGFGEAMALSYLEFMRVNYDKIIELMEFVKPKIEDIKFTQNIFSGKTIVITGTLSRPRDEIKKELESFGAKVSSSVSSKSDYLLSGESSGSKYDKAISLGVKIIDEKEYERLINEG